jgi:hypothetical protein
MALFPAANQGGNQFDLNTEVQQLRVQGLTDDQIVRELVSKGAKESQVITILGNLNASANNSNKNMMGLPSSPNDLASANNHPNTIQSPMFGASTNIPDTPQDLYDRIEEITEEMIDEKWDDLIKEVRKVVEWKNTVDSRIQEMDSTLTKLKDDFKLLHQGVLGKVEEYDKRMQEVGVELKSVGKVFKDVIPVFTENVKELRSITSKIKADNSKD